MKKRTHDYFEDFIRMAEFAQSAAETLIGILGDFSTSRLPQTLPELHSIEHNADICKHSLMQQLAKEFLPPIEREDIVRLAHELDDVTDSVEDVLLCIDMYNISVIRPDVTGFADVVAVCCRTLARLMKEFPSFRRSAEVHKLIAEVNRLEEEGDRHFQDCMRRLFTQTLPAAELIAWNDIYNRLERCCDCCEHAADATESVIMKNS